MVKFSKNNKKIIVTSALPYANGPIHVGHLVEYIQTDIFVRFLKLIGKDVVYCCADDTHGTPIELKAKELGIKPEDLIAKFFKEHQEDFDAFCIKFDSYYSTNSRENKYFSDLIFKRLKEKGFIYKKEIESMYSEKSKRFLPDRFIKGKCPKCKAPEQYGDVCENCGATYKPTDLVDAYSVTDGSKPILKKTEHYFFKLSEFSGQLEDWLNKNKNLQKEVVNFVKNWIKEGLEDWDISRDAPYFGFKIPDSELYYYVWLDAPIGYISSFANYLGNDVKKAEKSWNESEIIHFIGKDIAYFHFLFWPATLLGSGFKLPDAINVHGFLTVNGEKMSKSRGTFFTAREFAEKYPAEYLRFYYANVLSKKLADIDLNFEDFVGRVNNELAGNLGNFCFRIISFVNKNFNGKIEDIENSNELINKINQKIIEIKNYYENLNFNEAVSGILAISDLGNKYFQNNEPWKLIKNDKDKVQKICGLCLNIAKNLSILIQPILPKFSEELQRQLNVKDLKWKDLGFDLKEHKINKEKILINKIEKKAEEEKTKEIEYEVDNKVKDLGLKFQLAQINNIKIKKKSEGLEKLKKEIENNAKNIKLQDNKIYLESKKINRNLEPPYSYLINLIKEKGKLPTINTVVDSYNPVSVKYLVSAGIHDTAKIKGKVRFKLTDGSEKYIPLGSKELEKVEAGEYACVDDEHILCRLDVKQSEFTKVDDKTKSVMIYVQGNKENKDEDLKKALKEICGNTVKFCGGNYRILGEKEPENLFPLSLKVAKIIEVNEHPDAEKLYVLKIDLGSEKRQLVAGLKEHYKNEELLNKKIIVVTNLKHAKLRGIESQGMLLAAEDKKGTVGLLTIKDSKIGSEAKFGSLKSSNLEISFENFKKLKIIVKEGKVFFNGLELKISNETVSVEKVKEGIVR